MLSFVDNSGDFCWSVSSAVTKQLKRGKIYFGWYFRGFSAWSLGCVVFGSVTGKMSCPGVYEAVSPWQPGSGHRRDWDPNVTRGPEIP